MKKGINNMAVSVHTRLLHRAKAEGRVFNELLQLYGMERLLYRLSRSEHADRFVLKGALMLQLWGDGIARTTKDIDLHGRQPATVEEIIDLLQACVEVEVDDDGLRFPGDEISGEEIRLEAKYDGVRGRLRAYLGKAVIPLQVDVGFGDVIKPAPSRITYPVAQRTHSRRAAVLLGGGILDQSDDLSGVAAAGLPQRDDAHRIAAISEEIVDKVPWQAEQAH